MDLQGVDFNLKLVRASQTVAVVFPKGADGVGFMPFDRIPQRDKDGLYQGDLNLRIRVEGESL